MNKTDKVYKVEVTTPIQEFYLRVPKGVEINQEILENLDYVEDWWDTSAESDLWFRDICRKDRTASFSEVDKELWDEQEHPELGKDGKTYWYE